MIKQFIDDQKDLFNSIKELLFYLSNYTFIHLCNYINVFVFLLKNKISSNII